MSGGDRTICLKCDSIVESGQAGRCPNCGGAWLSGDSRIGPYRLVRLIASSPTSRVHLAWDEPAQRPVALKLILEFTEREELRFRRETRIASSLKHPHILQIVDYGAVSSGMFNMLYLATPYIEGQTLELTPRPVAEKIAILADIADALDYAHGQNVIHRDVKPSNILVDTTGRGFIIDFGIAKPIRESGEGVTVTGSIIGTPHYMSPEQARGDARIGPASDIFSLGATLYYAVTGRPPFDGEGSTMQIISRMAAEPVEPPSKFMPNIDPALERVILIAMHPRADRRFASASLFASTLRSLAAGKAVDPRKATRRMARPGTTRVRVHEADVALDLAERLLVLYECTNRESDELELTRIDAAVQKALIASPGHPRALIARGRLELVRNEWDAAVRSFTEVAGSFPHDSIPLAWRARALIRKYQHLRGIPPIFFSHDIIAVHPFEAETDDQRELRYAIEADLGAVERTASGERDPRVDGIAGVLDLYEGRYDEAVEKLRQAAASNPADLDPWLALGLVYMLKKDFAESLESLRRANSIRRSVLGLRIEAVAWAAVGQAKRARGEGCLAELEAATAAAEEAVKLAPDDLRVLRTRVVQNFGRVQERQRLGIATAEDIEAAMALGRDLVARNPRLVHSREALADFLQTIGHNPKRPQDERMRCLKEAIELSQGSLAIDPTWIESLSLLAFSKLYLSDLVADGREAAALRREAVEIAERGRSIHPTEGDLALALALGYRRLERLREARAALEEALRLKPELARSMAGLIAEIQDAGSKTV